MFKDVNSEKDMIKLGKTVGILLHGGEVIELIGDVGSGKTTFAKGVAAGLDVSDNIQSPSFTISRIYKGRDNITLAHYDFYRLKQSGIMGCELDEATKDPLTVTIIEWAELVKGVLPTDRMTIKIAATSETCRKLSFLSGGEKSNKLMENINHDFAS